MTHENLWAPWRMQYIRQIAPDAEGAPPGDAPACFMCDAARHQPPDDAAQQRLVLVNDARGLILLNRYPYTNGHLLVAPADHVASLADMTPQQRGDLMELTALAERLLNTAVNPQGMNIGINLGRCAGAGLPGHVHVHLVPRWYGDTNYMQTVGRVRVIPEALEESYAHLAHTLANMQSHNAAQPQHRQ